jgi:hypothetical protein
MLGRMGKFGFGVPREYGGGQEGVGRPPSVSQPWRDLNRPGTTERRPGTGLPGRVARPPRRADSPSHEEPIKDSEVAEAIPKSPEPTDMESDAVSGQKEVDTPSHEEPIKDSEVAEAIPKSPEPTDMESDALSGQVDEFAKDSLTSFAQAAVKVWAHAHGLSAAYEIVQLLYGAAKWERVEKDGRGVNIIAPLPVGDNLVFDASFHLGGDPGTPVVTFGIAPAGESGAGALTFGNLEADPAPSHVHDDGNRAVARHQRLGPVEIVPLHLPGELPKDLNPADSAAAARELAKQSWLPRLVTGRQRLREEGVELVIGCDSRAGVVVWANPADTSRSEPACLNAAGDRLSMELVPGSIDLRIGCAGLAELVASLHVRDTEAALESVLIARRTGSLRERGVEANTETASSSATPGGWTDHGGEAAVNPQRLGGGARPSSAHNTTTTSEATARSAVAHQAMEISEFRHVPVTSLWPTTTHDFMPWLARNPSRLGKELGIDIELDNRDHNVTHPSVHIIGREVAAGSPVLIEVQYGPSEYDYLGHMLALAAKVRPTILIWIAEEFREEHRASLGWLNEQCNPTIRFFGVELSALTLAGDPIGRAVPIFKPVAKPNTGSRQTGRH